MQQYFQWEKGIINFCDVSRAIVEDQKVLICYTHGQGCPLSGDIGERFMEEYKRYIAEIERDIEMPDLHLQHMKAELIFSS